MSASSSDPLQREGREVGLRLRCRESSERGCGEPNEVGQEGQPRPQARWWSGASLRAARMSSGERGMPARKLARSRERACGRAVGPPRDRREERQA
jgi:hypothetical protein